MLAATAAGGVFRALPVDRAICECPRPCLADAVHAHVEIDRAGVVVLGHVEHPVPGDAKAIEAPGDPGLHVERVHAAVRPSEEAFPLGAKGVA